MIKIYGIAPSSALRSLWAIEELGGEGLGNVVGEATARALAHEAGFAHFEKLPIENAAHQLFLARKG